MCMPNNPSARLGGRSSRFGRTQIATRRARQGVWDTTSWASSYPGNCRRHWRRLESTSDWSCALIRNTHFSCIRTRIVSSEYCVFTNGFLSPSRDEAYASNAQRAARKACPLSRWGTLWSLGNRLIPRRLALSSRSSGARCPGGEVRTNHRMCLGLVCCLRLSRAALTTFWSLGGVFEVRTSQLYLQHVAFASTEETLRATR
ncbi:hypothetical protein DFH94DRAFT_22778 [Russula ochroleuca]|uniref:Uncharacterized protein n=1 Tax=Russula ochroleuca TaxID=152965 RepID=A0A9P5N664_9AGAM|nr:hypothetical protein DFH94DRAFT_22778 [Russula ochroleuca]